MPHLLYHPRRGREENRYVPRPHHHPYTSHTLTQAQVAGGLPALSDNAVTPRNSDPKPDALNASTDDM